MDSNHEIIVIRVKDKNSTTIWLSNVCCDLFNEYLGIFTFIVHIGSPEAGQIPVITTKETFRNIRTDFLVFN